MEVADHRDDGNENQSWGEHRKRDAEEAANGTCSVYCSCVVKLLGNRLEPGDEDEHVVAEALPHRHENDCRHRPVRITEPIDRSDAYFREAEVDETVARVIQVPPHNGNGDESRDEWREVDSAEEGLEANELRVEQKCGGERDCDCQWPADKSEIESVLQCLPEIGSVEELAVIVQADEARIGRIGDNVNVEVSNA